MSAIWQGDRAAKVRRRLVAEWCFGFIGSEKVRFCRFVGSTDLFATFMASHLTGRHHTIELLPFSFRDWCAYKGVAMAPLTTKNTGLLMGAFDDYMR